jgi:hypothetical protein
MVFSGRQDAGLYGRRDARRYIFRPPLTPSRGCDAFTVSYYLGDQRARKNYADLGLGVLPKSGSAPLPYWRGAHISSRFASESYAGPELGINFQDVFLNPCPH